MNWLETLETVRFNEVDQWQIAWHGHYVAWFEVGRLAMLKQFDLTPEQMVALGYIAPVVHLECDYKEPARTGEEIIIRTTVFKPEIAAIEFRFEILRAADRTLLAKGSTTQVLLTTENVMIYKITGEIGRRLNELIAFCKETPGSA